ncbi:hypothetical protein L2729_19790 [Shewanella gelidimarina]|uniref:hypothetical protein n=1 Tax=Shewanella gelidimarina TaxID=56813 RepID=UPI00200BC13B|nr:hypothetical protein [Shewanella gelidimarina]MCL1060209.1 hypothetical protein [Shewanella gelidimarina]
MKKSTLAIALTTILAISGATSVVADEALSQTGKNGVTIDLTGDFYHPNETQVLQENAPVIEFSGLNEQGGKDIVAGYITEFGSDIFAEAIKDYLAQLNGALTTEQLADVLNTKQDMIKHFPNVVNFYNGIADATGFTADEVYMAAWASDGMFAYDIQAIVKEKLPQLKAATESNRGCTAIAWNNGVIGQNQDMPLALGGHGAIWKSGEIIVQAPEPFFMGIAMTKSVGSTINTIDTFNFGELEQGMPLSGTSLGLLSKFDNAQDIAKYMDDIKINSAPAYSLSDTSGNVLTVEAQRGNNVVLDGSNKGFVVHTNHPVGLEDILVNRYANGNAKAFDSAVATTTWRQVHAEAFAKFSPYQTVDALKDVLSQKPLFKTPYKGNAFVSTNSIIHDVNAGCSYGTTWLASMQDYTKVCFD